MDEDDKAKLQRKVTELNEELLRISAKYGNAIQIRPGARFNTEEGYAAVYIDIETGCIHIA